MLTMEDMESMESKAEDYLTFLFPSCSFMLFMVKTFCFGTVPVPKDGPVSENLLSFGAAMNE
jgi:hypothetical protein